ncbi:MAG: HlyD family efflux transporter periplasmic adaptor subunit [Planctomycetales bacterium]|nr:HlyD family efflux transporter periplasmic adaptor subunit [Planctomycetales bacterium]
MSSPQNWSESFVWGPDVIVGAMGMDGVGEVDVTPADIAHVEGVELPDETPVEVDNDAWAVALSDSDAQPNSEECAPGLASHESVAGTLDSVDALLDSLDSPEPSSVAQRRNQLSCDDTPFEDETFEDASTMEATLAGEADESWVIPAAEQGTDDVELRDRNDAELPQVPEEPDTTDAAFEIESVTDEPADAALVDEGAPPTEAEEHDPFDNAKETNPVDVLPESTADALDNSPERAAAESTDGNAAAAKSSEPIESVPAGRTDPGSGPVQSVTTQSWKGVVAVQRELAQLLGNEAEAPQLPLRVAAITARESGALWLGMGSMEEPASLQLRTLHGETARHQEQMDICRRVAELVLAKGQPIALKAGKLSESGQFLCVGVPIPSNDRRCLLGLVFSDGHQIPGVVAIMQAAAAAMAASVLAARCRRSETVALHLAAISELVARIESQPDTDAAAHTLADSLARHFACDQVVVGLCRPAGAPCEVVAISERPDVAPTSEETRLAQAALQEIIARGDSATWPALEADESYALRTHQQLIEHHRVESVSSFLLRDASGQVLGAWLMLGSRENVQSPTALSFAHAIQLPIASSMQLLMRAQPSRLNQLQATSNEWLSKRGLSTIALSVVLAGAMCVPIPYRVSCDSQVQPATRRYVAAPFAAPLEEAFVEPGDVVEEGQLLARIDGRELRIELTGVEAELNRATKELAGFVAAHDSGKAQIAELEVERLMARHDLLQHRISDLEVRSPVAGMIVSGDLTKSVGVPLSEGQSLFEVAPLDNMIVEVAIPERDRRLVRTDMPVKLWVDGLPMKSWKTSVDRIQPRAEIRDEENVFVAEVSLENEDGQLRPGMRGRARIATGKRTLGWTLFHKSIAQAARWTGW